MRLEISCRKCSEQISLGQSGTVYSRLCLLRDDCVYKFECPEGHLTTTVLRTPKHEVLYSIGANALLDGYFRECISSFAGALERYFEFGLRVIFRENEKRASSLQEVWKLLVNQSERQFGAFITVWMMVTGEKYTSLALNQIDKQTKVRNEVVHKGRIPTYAECMVYGQYVLDVIKPIEKILIDRYAKAHKDECFALARKVMSDTSLPITVLSEFSVLSTAFRDDIEFESALARLLDVRRRNSIYSNLPESFRSRTVFMSQD